MARGRLPNLTLKLAVIKKVSKTTVDCEYLGQTTERSFSCPISHPYVGNGGGFLSGVERGTIVVIGIIPPDREFIVAYLPPRKSYFGQEGLTNTPFYATALPELEEGELMIKSSKSSSYINLLPDGNLLIDGRAGDSEADIELSPSSKAMFTRVYNKYDFTEAGRCIEGVIKRDKNKKEIALDTETIDFLSSEIYDDLLSTIGRSPSDEVQNRTATIIREFTRNPALVEKRNITYEYADSFGVRSLPTEAKAMLSVINTDGVDHLVRRSGARQDRRTNTLDLDLFNYNHLMEKIEGTVVDIYGNVLDINRNIINIPDTTTLDKDTEKIKGLQDLYRYMRRSIKYHFEINSRKEISDSDLSRKNISKYAREHSRWSVDVDGEGLTKINIPASSNTGNIPVLGRYFTSVTTDEQGNINKEERDSGQYKDPDGVDIRMSGFGSETQTIKDSEYSPTTIDNKSIATTGTAYHDLMNIAPLIFSSGKLRNPSPSIGSATVNPMEEIISNKMGSVDANAGGRSINANFDGSIEMSVGADTIDNKSILLDLQGAMISHFGKDKNGRSLIHQNDGDVIIQIGGEGIDDSGFRPGRLEMHLAREKGKAQKIIIDENGITIDVQGNALLSSSGDFTIGAGGKLLLAGELIFNYGSFDDDVDGTRAPNGTERLVVRNGIPNHS